MGNSVSLNKGAGLGLWNKYFIAVLICSLCTSTVGKYYEGTIALHIDELGGATSFTGLLLAAFTVSAAVFRILGGKLCDIKSRFLTIQLGCGLFFIGGLIFFLFPNHVELMIPGRIFQGAGFALCGAGVGAAVPDTSPASRLGEANGYNGLAISASGVIGPLLGLTVFEASGFQNVSLVACITVVVGALVTALFCRYEFDPNFTVEKAELPASELKVPDGEEYTGIWRIIEKRSLKAALLVFLYFMGASGVFAYVALHARQSGIGNISIFYILSAGAMFIVRPIISKLDDRCGPLTSIIPGSILNIVAFVMLMYIGKGQWMYSVSGILYGIGNAFLQPSLATLAMRGIPPHRRGVAFATYGTPIEIGIGIGSLMWGAIADSFGIGLIYLGSAICVAVMLIIALFFFAGKGKNVAVRG